MPIESGGSVVLSSLPGYEIVYAQNTGALNITDTAEGTGTALISCAATVFDGGPVYCEFFCPQVITDTNAAADIVTATLFEGATQITRLGIVRTVVTASPLMTSMFCRYKFTPTAASHTYLLCAYANSTTGTPRFQGGAGGVTTNPPTYIRFVKA